ncbi:MAG TPA: hypothetical protein VK203_16830 [Nostocaceae cyanobacterium]|nr:hypothetical protein [Nostocaceae cyanobacterium]
MTDDSAAQTHHHDCGAATGQAHELQQTARLTRARRLAVGYVSHAIFTLFNLELAK